MSYAQRYLGRSGVSQRGSATRVRFSPNLVRDKVFFQGELREPIRYREAMSALHEVVVGDLTFQKRDKTAYATYKQELLREEEALRRTATSQARLDALRDSFGTPEPKNLKRDFKRARKKYYGARSKWIRDLRTRDSKLWWLLDPVITVAPDVVLFECFSKDESSYGCLTVDREAFSHQDMSPQGLGTTNVDYSWSLYEHFQTLRSYRPTQLSVDPEGFDVQVAGHPDLREDKIDLPPSWLKGFGQIQAAQMLPATKVTLPRETVYGLLAFLTRNREKQGPRAIRFELENGKPPSLVLEPWERTVEAAAPRYEGESQSVRIWGRRRLLVLARLLPLLQSVDVYLLGTGLPSVWAARLGGMSFTLALSGWTTNDWTSGANLALMAGHFSAAPDVTVRLLRVLESRKRASLAELKQELQAPEHALWGSLHALALSGQAIFDHAHQVYRYRLAMPEPISASVLGPEHPELEAAREALAAGQVRVERHELISQTRTLLAGRVGGTECEALLDPDGLYKKASCTCSYFYRSRLRKGPCRHLLALKLATTSPRFGDKPTLVNP